MLLKLANLPLARRSLAVYERRKHISLYQDLTVLRIIFAIFVACFNVSVEYFTFSS